MMSNVAAVAAKYGISAEDLDWHVEAEHGWEPHDLGYSEALEVAARCHMIYGRECHPPMAGVA
jgi:hypothetical protein